MLLHAHRLLLARGTFVACPVACEFEPLSLAVVSHGGNMLVCVAPGGDELSCSLDAVNAHACDAQNEEDCIDDVDSALEGDTSVFMPIGGEAHLFQFESKLIIDVASVANKLAVIAEPAAAMEVAATDASLSPRLISVDIGVFELDDVASPDGVRAHIHTFAPRDLAADSARTCILSNACVLAYDATGNIHVQFAPREAWCPRAFSLAEHDALVSVCEIIGCNAVLAVTRMGAMHVLHFDDIAAASVFSWRFVANANLLPGHIACAASATCTHSGKCALVAMHEHTELCFIYIFNMDISQEPVTTIHAITNAYTWQMLTEDGMRVYDNVRIWMSTAQAQLKLVAACAHDTHWLEYALDE
jgi:hypothetical protein